MDEVAEVFVVFRMIPGPETPEIDSIWSTWPKAEERNEELRQRSQHSYVKPWTLDEVIRENTRK
jgi:hypothetical protein